MTCLQFCRKCSILQPIFDEYVRDFQKKQDVSTMIGLQLGTPNGTHYTEFNGKAPNLCDINKTNMADLRGQISVGY